MVRGVIKDVKDYHNNCPEIQDRFSINDEKSKMKIQGHHIFPQSQYPDIKAYRENIILLMRTQHREHAHSNNKVSIPYQYLCLQRKLDSIEACEENPNCNFYSFFTFKEILHLTRVIDKKDKDKSTYDDIRRLLAIYFTKK